MQRILSVILRPCHIQLVYRGDEETVEYLDYQGDFHSALLNMCSDFNDLMILFVDLNYPLLNKNISHKYLETCKNIAPGVTVKSVSFSSFINPNEVTYYISGDIQTETVVYYQNKIEHVENIDLGEGTPGSAKRIFYDTMRYLAQVLSGVGERTNFSNELIHRYHLLSIDDIQHFSENCSKKNMIDIALLTANFSSVNQYAYRNFTDRIDEVKHRSEHLLSHFTEKPIKIVFSGCLFDKNSMFKDEILNQISKMGSIVEICDVNSLMNRYLERNVE